MPAAHIEANYSKGTNEIKLSKKRIDTYHYCVRNHVIKILILNVHR